MQIVELVNTGSKPVSFNGNERVTLAPKQRRLVPWEFATAWLGDPLVAAHERPYAYSQTRLLWGYSAGADTDEDFDRDKKPSVEVLDRENLDEQGQPTRIFMLLDDPEGNRRPGSLEQVSDEATNDVRLLQAQLAQMAERQAKLEALLLEKSNASDAAMDPQMQTALATAQTSEATNSETQLPTPKPTPKGAVDSPRATRVRGGAVRDDD